MSTSVWRLRAERLKGEAAEAVSQGNALRDAGKKEEAQEHWHHASQLETIARLYEERAVEEEATDRLFFRPGKQSP